MRNLSTIKHVIRLNILISPNLEILMMLFQTLSRSCTRILRTFPSSITAKRLKGDGLVRNLRLVDLGDYLTVAAGCQCGNGSRKNK